jgi:hypothetical protein
VGADEPAPEHDLSPERPHCSTRATPADRAVAGERSTIECFATMAEAFAAQGASIDQYPDLADPAQPALPGGAARVADNDPLWAVHKDINDIFSESLSVFGPLPCNAGGVDLGGSDWNDRITVTQHYGCGDIKHWQHSGFTGTSQITSGSFGQNAYLNGSLNNQASSMRYN